MIRPSSSGSPIALRATEVAPSPPWTRLLAPVACFAAGAALVGVVALAWPRAAAPAAELAPLQARVERVEAMLAPIGEAAAQAVAQAGRAEAAAQAPPAAPAAAGERFLAAALLLQASIATPRPWLREYQTMAELAPPGALPRPLAEVLQSHAARGLPTEADLRERFAALAPQLVARAPRTTGAVEGAANLLRGAVAAIGLATPPPPSAAETAIAGVAAQLRRGNLAGAAADAAALDPSLQPVLAGWLAQARARLAVEQAVQEVLLRALARPPRPA